VPKHFEPDTTLDLWTNFPQPEFDELLLWERTGAGRWSHKSKESCLASKCFGKSMKTSNTMVTRGSGLSRLEWRGVGSGLFALVYVHLKIGCRSPPASLRNGRYSPPTVNTVKFTAHLLPATNGNHDIDRCRAPFHKGAPGSAVRRFE